jgi:hypothetical protein
MNFFLLGDFPRCLWVLDVRTSRFNIQPGCVKKNRQCFLPAHVAMMPPAGDDAKSGNKNFVTYQLIL